jgi:hypothetical protein
MKITRRQLFNIINEAINSSNVDAGEFPWPGDKPWWANSAVANGRWDKDANVRYDLVEKHKELVAEFADMAESSMPKGKVTPGKMEIKKEKGGLFGLFKKKNKKKNKSSGQAQSKVVLPKAASTAVGLYRKLSSTSQLRYVQQAMFANIADRYFIGMELKRFEDPQGMTFLRKLMGDIEFLVDFGNGQGRARKGIVLAALQAHYSKEKELALDFHEKVGTQSSTKRGSVVAGDDAGDFEAEYEGEIAEDMIYTIKNEKRYVYKKSEDAPNGWQYAMSSDLDSGNPVWKNINKAGANNLNKEEASGEIEVNPMTTGLQEGLSRGSLYRNRYRRY